MKEYVYYVAEMDDFVISEENYGKKDFVHHVPCVASYFGHTITWFRGCSVVPLGEL